MENENTFEAMLEKHRIAVERYINFRMPSRYDADDVIQETYLAAFQHFSELRNHDLFKVWILTIAKNQCRLWYRKNHAVEYASIDEIAEIAEIGDGKAMPDAAYDDTVDMILRLLPPDSAEVLRLTMEGYRQSEISDKLAIPLGTVKSRVYNAKKQFRAVCPAEMIQIYERGKIKMAKSDYTYCFPADMPELKITPMNIPFFEVKFAEESFIIPKIGNRNAEGTYRYPSKKLAIVSNCYVPKAAVVHEAPGVKICRDTYNVREGRLYKNEAVWFTQLTDEYVRDLGTIIDSDDEYPTEIYTFLEEDYDVAVNGNDRVHGRPLLIRENPARVDENGIHADEYGIRYTMGVHEVSIGKRSFETIKFILIQRCGVVTENYVDRSGRLVLMRWYESKNSIDCNENYTEEFAERVSNNPTITVNGVLYTLIEDRISEYSL